MNMYKKLKKQNGEKFARTIRNFHDVLLNIPDLDIKLRHAGRDAEPLLSYLTDLIVDDNNDDVLVHEQADPFALLDQAGYDAFYADTLAKQNSIKRYYAPGELLCTFNHQSRYQDYHVVHAVKKDADKIYRKDFNGEERRQDDYGTSVISIQMLKSGGHISIKNRYNHTVSNCDSTFDSNPDNIIEGLSIALKTHFNVDFSTSKHLLPNGFVLIGNQILKYHEERNNIYYGHNVLARNGIFHVIDRSAGDAMFDGFLFDNKTKTLRKIDPAYDDSFPNNFNKFYGGNRGLHVQNGNLMLNDVIIIGAEETSIKTLYLPAFTSMSNYCLFRSPNLTHLNAPTLQTMGKGCLKYARSLSHFKAPKLIRKGKKCLEYSPALENFTFPQSVQLPALTVSH